MLAVFAVDSVFAVGTGDLASVFGCAVGVGDDQLAGVVDRDGFDATAVSAILTVLAVGTVFAVGAGFAFVALRALLAVLSSGAVLAVLSVGTVCAVLAVNAVLTVGTVLAVLTGDLTQVDRVVFVVGVGNPQVAVVSHFCLDDAAVCCGLLVGLFARLLLGGLQIEADLDRVVVGGAEGIAVAVELVVAFAEEILHVGHAARVLEGDGLIAVDVPHRRVLHQVARGGVGQHVVKRAEAAAELVGGLVEVLISVDEREATLLQGCDCVFPGVGVQVAQDEGGQVGPVIFLGQVIEECLRLRLAHGGVVALAVAGVLVATRDGALGLEVVDHGDEVAFALNRLEFLGKRLAGGAGEGGVVEDLGLADRADLVLLVDEGNADEVLVSAELGWRGHELPLLLARGLVQRVDEVAQGLVALGDVAGNGCGVLNLRQTEHVDVEGVDRGDDLRLLILECRLGVRAANIATICGNRRVVHVGVGLAPVLVFAEGGEVVEHVEEADGVVALNLAGHVDGGGARVLPGDRELVGGVLAGDRLQRLVAPLVEGVVHHYVGLELDLVGGADGFHTVVGGDQVGQRRVLVGAEVVAGAPVVEVDRTRYGVGFVGDKPILARGVDVGEVVERLVTCDQAEIAGVVQRVVVGHRVGARADQHALVGLAGVVASRQLVDSDRLRCLESLVQLLLGGNGDLGLVVVLGDLAGDLQGIAALRELARCRVLAQVYEDGVGGVADLLLRAASACGLQEEAVLAALVEHGGDHALGGYGLALEWGGRAGALDVSDRGDLSRGRRLHRRVVGFARLNWGTTGALRRRRCDLEVGGVVVGVYAGLLALDGGAVGSALRGRTLEVFRPAPADEVDLVAGGVVKHGDCSLAAEVEGAFEVGVFERVVRVIARGTLDQEVALGGHRAGQCRWGAGTALGGLLVEHPPGDVDVGVGGVVQLDEVVGDGGTGVAAASVDLVDDDVGAVDGGVRGGHGDGAGGERDDKSSGEAVGRTHWQSFKSTEAGTFPAKLTSHARLRTARAQAKPKVQQVFTSKTATSSPRASDILAHVC